MRHDHGARAGVQLRLFDVRAAGLEVEQGGAPRRRRRRLRGRVVASILGVGLATAGMFAGSYAAWTASTSNANNAVTSGTLTMSNDKDAAAVFTAANIKPGDTGTDTVTVGNTGSLPMSVALTQDTLSASGIEVNLRLSLHDDTKDFCVWPDNAAGACSGLGAWDATALLTSKSVAGTAGAQWAAGESHTFTASWELLTASTNADQGKTGSFQLVWSGTQ